MKLSTKQKELLEAIESGDLPRVKHLVMIEGVNPNFGSSEYIENNPICYASLNGMVDIAFWLIREGGTDLSLDIFKFVTNVVGDISTSNLLDAKMRKET